MTTLYLEYSEHHTGGQPKGRGQYSQRKEKVVHFQLKKCTLNKSECDWFSCPIEVDFIVVRGETVYPVVVRYTTGDSFGKCSGNHRIWGIFKTGAEAIAAEDEINREYKAYKSDNEKYTIPPDKKDWKYRPWMDYFGGLDEIEITPMLVR